MNKKEGIKLINDLRSGIDPLKVADELEAIIKKQSKFYGIPFESKRVGKFSLIGKRMRGHLIQKYDSVNECAAVNNIDRSYLSERIRDKQPAKGFIYQYL